MRALASCRGPFCREPFHRIRVQDVRCGLCDHRASQVEPLPARCAGGEAPGSRQRSELSFDHLVPTLSDPFVQQQDLVIGEAAGWSDARPWAQPKATLAYSRGSETEFIALLEHWLVLNATLDGPNGLRELMQGCA